jgi:hypothetical protein
LEVFGSGARFSGQQVSHFNSGGGAPGSAQLEELPELQSREIPDEIPAENGVESEQLRVLAYFNLNSSCRGGKDEKPIAVAFGRRDIVWDHGDLRAAP